MEIEHRNDTYSLEMIFILFRQLSMRNLGGLVNRESPTKAGCEFVWSHAMQTIITVDPGIRTLYAVSATFEIKPDE